MGEGGEGGERGEGEGGGREAREGRGEEEEEEGGGGGGGGGGFASSMQFMSYLEGECVNTCHRGEGAERQVERKEDPAGIRLHLRHFARSLFVTSKM